MKTTDIVKNFISLAAVLLVGIGSAGCTGNVFSSLGDDTEKNLLYLLLAGGSKTSSIRLDSISSDGVATTRYGTGSTINITLTFEAPVTLDEGTIDVTLNSGAVVQFDPDGPVDTFTAPYIIQDGDTTGVDFLNATAVTVSNGTLRDADGLLVVPAVPSNNISATSEFHVDGIRPRISSVTSTTANGTYGEGATIDVTVNFTEPVNLAGGNLEVTLDTGVTVNIAPFGPASSALGTYVVASGHTSADLDVTGIALGVGASLVDDCDVNPNPMNNFDIPANQDLGDLKDIEIDTTAPTILSVTSTTDNGTYGTGAEVNVQIEFSENVILSGGTLDVTLNSGAVLNIPAFGVPASTVNYTYHVSSGDTTSGADLRVNGIALGGGASLADDCDGSPNPMVNFSVPGGQNLDDLKDIKIDATAPEISEINSTKMNGAYRAGEDINVTVTFSEDVTLAGGNLVITLDSGGTVTISSINSSTTASGTYTVGSGQNSEDLTVDSVSLSGGATLRSDLGNDAFLGLGGVNAGNENLGDNRDIVIDTTAPTIQSVTSTTDNGTYGTGAAINVTVNFSEPVKLETGTLTVTLDTGGTVTINSFGTLSSTASGTYTVGAGHTSSDLTVNADGIEASGGTLVDRAANALTDFSIPGGQNLDELKDIKIDAVAPVIDSISSTTDDDTYGTGAAINVTVNFSENVILSGGTLDVTLDTGAVVSITAFGPASSASGTYTVASGHSSSDLSVTGIALGGGATLTDDCDGNPNPMVDFSVPGGQNINDLKAIVIDAVAPVIDSVSSTTDNGTYGTGAAVNITITFSKAVALVGAGGMDVTLNSGATVNVPAFASSVTASVTYTVAAGDTTSGADLDVTGITLVGGATLRDSVPNNPNDADLSLPSGQNLGDNKEIKIDGVAPYITEISSTMNGTYGVGADIDVTVTFSEAVTLAGGGDLEIALDSGGTVTISSISNSTTAAGTYTVGSGQDSADLTVTSVTLDGATLRDGASNNASLALTYVNTNTENLGDNNNIVIDTTAPYITEISSAMNGTYGAGTDIDVTITFSEAVTLAGGGDLEIALDSGGTVTISSISNSTTAAGTYTVASGQSSADLTVTGVSLDSATLKDGASNDASLALTYVNTNAENLGDNNNIVIDAVAPAIVSAETMDDDGNGRIDHYKITFSKNVDDTSFPGYSGSSETGDPQSKWLVSGYSGVVMVRGSAAPEADTPNDTVIYLAFNEIGSGYDTGAKPDLYTEPDPELTDTVANNPNPLAQVGMAAAIEIDGAAPIITAATGVTGTTTLAINFSEVVDGDGSLNDCDQALTTGSFAYLDNHSGDASDISSMIDASACGDRMVTVELDSPLAIEDLNVDEVRVGSTAIYDMADNPAGTAREVAITGAISPYVLGVSASGARKIRITYSEPVDNSGGATGALNHANYILAEDPDEPGCSGGGSGADIVNIDTGTAIVEITAGTVFELTTDADQCSSTIYRLAVDNVIDVDDGLEIVDPKSDTFQGNERLKVSAASALSLTTMVVTFNKDVEEGDGAGGAETEDRYMFTGVTNLGTITGAVRGTGGTANQVTLTHTIEQTGGNYTVIASNGVDGDGFDDASFGAIQIDGGSETLQPSPRDRWLWSGYGEGIEFFVQGPIASDPFGDGSDFGYLASYQGRVYIGPNRKGNASTRMEADGDNPTPIFFSFEKDTSTANSTGTHSNSATTRDGGTAVPPYVSIGHTGCTSNNADLATGCGPDNENGRGLFVNGTISGTPYLFITGGRSAGDNDYLYHTTDTGTTLGFDFVDCSATFDDGDSNAISGNRGTESIVVFNSKVYWMEPGDQWYRPYLVKLNNLDPQSEENVDSVWMRIRYMTGIGAHSTTKPNYADRLGGTLFEFNDRLYLANSGSVRDVTGGDWDCPEGEDGDRCSNNGGIVRSTNNDPARCTGADTCSNWTDITPTSAKFTYYFSKILPGLADLIPADRPIPSFASYKGNLYMIRNACTTNMIDRGCDPVGSPCSDDVECPAGNEVPQLWKCVPGGDGHCDAGDWELVAENASTGKTNMGDGNNTHITLLVANGDYLYVGFDNASTGVEIWRTNESDPENEGHFTQIGGNGLGDVDMLEIYSAISISIDTDYYLYVSAGKNATPVSVYRQKND